MLTVQNGANDLLHYRIEGNISHEDLRVFYEELAHRYQQHGRLRLLAEVDHFTGYAGWRALLVFARHEWTLLYRVRQYAMATEQPGFGLVVKVINAVPGLSARQFPTVAAASDWLARPA